MDNSLDILAMDLRSGMESSGRSRKAAKIVQEALTDMGKINYVPVLMLVLDSVVEKLRGLYKEKDRDFLILEEKLNMAALRIAENIRFRERINAELFEYTDNELDEICALSQKHKIKAGAAVFCKFVKVMEAATNFDQIVEVYDQAIVDLENIYSEGGEEFRDLAIWRSLLALRRKTCLDSIR